MQLEKTYRQNVANINPQEIARRSQMALDSRPEAMRSEFDNKLFEKVMELKDKFKCDSGAGESGCDILASELSKLSDKFAKEYFTGREAKLKSVINEVMDYLIKKNLPAEVEKEKDQYSLMGVDVSGDNSALLIVDSSIKLLLKAAERMNSLARLKEEGNVFYIPGEQY